MADTDVKLLAYVPSLEPSVLAYCARREQKFPYFREGFVDTNLGRHIHLTDAIREATEGYAIADAKGVVQARYSKFENALRALETAKPRFVTELELEETEPAVAGAGA